MRRRGVRPYVLIHARSYLAAAIGIAPTILVLVFVFLPLVAGARGDSLRKGNAVRPAVFLGVPVLDVRAPLVTVVPRVNADKSPSLLPLTGCYFLIGTGDAATIIYDANDKRLYRLPKAELVFSLRPEQSHC
jgi:hypothetical protein